MHPKQQPNNTQNSVIFSPKLHHFAFKTAPKNCTTLPSKEHRNNHENATKTVQKNALVDATTVVDDGRNRRATSVYGINRHRLPPPPPPSPTMPHMSQNRTYAPHVPPKP